MRRRQILFALALPTFAAPTVETGIGEESLLSQALPIHERENLRDSVKWQGFVAAQEAAAGGDWEKARRLVFKLREFMPDHLMLLEQKARLHELAGEWAEAESAWYELIARQPQRLDLLPELAMALLRQDRGDESSRIVGVILDRQPGHPEGRWLRVLASLRKGRRETVSWSVPEMAQLSLRLSAEPRRWVAWLGEAPYRDLTGFVWSGGQWDATSFLPENAGELAASGRRIATALVEAEQALALGQWPRALEALGRAETAGASGPLLAAYRAYAQGKNGSPGPALRALDAIAGRYEGQPVVLALRAHLFLDLQRYGEARGDFMRLPAGGPEAIFGRLLAHLGESDMDAAWPLYVELAKRHRNDLLRLLRQHEPLLAPLRARPDFLRPLQPTPQVP
jgi:tetratricopeptide (TPR) repeat protein